MQDFYSKLILAFLALLANALGIADVPHVRYVIIGGGPGGLQLAHYLDSAGRDYVVYEKHSGAGS